MNFAINAARKSRPRIRGAITALATPFIDGKLDEVGLMALVEWQIRSGIDGLAVCSVTGEGPVLDAEERKKIVAIAVEIAEGKVPVIVATGTNSTATTIARTREAEALGADVALVTIPYYSKPTQKGICHHFEAIAANSGIPLMVDNAPSHTALDATPATIERLAEIQAIIGIRDATGDVSRIASLQPALRERFTLLSGHDPTALAFAMAGGHGTISAVANVVPRLVASMQRATNAGHIPTALSIYERFFPLIRALRRESEPVGVKYALHLLRKLDPEVRLPLVPIEPETEAAIHAALQPFMNDRMSRVEAGSLIRFDI
ncbi:MULTISPECIES: 4-hydroxy-tetrahydrodipicolinate synthase [unclassified Sinorhizobium]|uniref:4-hydroxy-tetrahydrodipicolinate synthase n=1 Tax=unclassified Sinorhizobium TaxID=2613772 RepID=UPI00352613E5